MKREKISVLRKYILPIFVCLLLAVLVWISVMKIGYTKEYDGITVVDFKTDAVREENLDHRVEMYRQQIAVYADAMERIYERPVKERLLYFFALERFVKV